MQLFSGLRKFNVPIMKTAWPFAVGGVITFYLFAKIQDSMLQIEPHRSDPRNPDAHKYKHTAPH
ncbi:ATP synthase j chain-domain-containing protein [Syncephalis plumigaleata]|nr:ATP synthase j chain-domain-containing protein [Syncephalis plumigaleata]